MTDRIDDQPDLDKHTLLFTIKQIDGELRAGDTLVIRNVRYAGDGLVVAAISEKALKDEASKIFK